MASEAAHSERDGGHETMPAGVRIALAVGLGLVFAGAFYLISVRGHALLLDLSALSGRAWCF
ncbi:MAG TPA: hypothetical protein VG900_14900 [Hyphomicrobiaceae bacterium]|nr:hypothetical protein [Hyphomicrobiaceae bacterium]